jgi:putative Mg2+ transporter-C (MgtC) family protein
MEWLAAIDWGDDLYRLGLLLLSAVLGGAIGLERELRGKAAGLRTHIFIAVAATLFMILGRVLIAGFELAEGNAANVTPDPTRTMHAVIVGISFIGAGTIIQRGGASVAGLTTAASIWLVAAIGIAVAVGQWPLAIMVTVLALIVLIVLGWVEQRLGKTFDRSK